MNEDGKTVMNRFQPDPLKGAMKAVDEQMPLSEKMQEAIAYVKNKQKDLLGRERVIGLRNAKSEVGVNPKDRIGAAKVDFTLIPTSAKVALAKALMDGATKYGPYNWRVEPVQFRTYLGAAERHLESVKEGEWFASDSLIEHLGHVMACCAILIDAMSQNTLIDDRPIHGEGATIIEETNAWIKESKPEGWGR